MDIKQTIAELCKEGIKEYGVSSVPKVTLREDEENSQQIFGRTAYYDPNEKHIVLYISGRHPKDILRSFCHELIHHLQNERGDLSNIDSSDPEYAQNDTHLRDMEEEAYLKGNFMLRDYEDRVKNQNPLNEGTYSESEKNQIDNILRGNLADLRDNFENATNDDDYFKYYEAHHSIQQVMMRGTYDEKNKIARLKQ